MTPNIKITTNLYRFNFAMQFFAKTFKLSNRIKTIFQEEKLKVGSFLTI